MAGVDGRQSRHVPVPEPLGRGRSGEDPVRADDAPHAARQRVPVLRRRARHARHRRHRAAPRGPGGQAAVPRVRPRSGAHADAMVARAGRGVHLAERGAMAALRRHRRVQRRGPATRPGLDALVVPRPHRSAGRRPRPARRRLRASRRRGRALGVAAGRAGDRGAESG